MPELPINSKERLQALSPAEVMDLLKAGNVRYVKKRSRLHDAEQMRQLTAAGQHPYAIVLSCIDSRVIPEAIFDAGIGELFVARIAGNIVNRDILGSMEYACAVTGSKVVVVLGHTACGAVKGAIDNVVLGNLTGALRPLQLAVAQAEAEYPGDPAARGSDFADRVAAKNVELSVEDVRAQSSVLREMEEKGEIIIIGAMYDHVTGEVRWLD